MHSIKNQYVGIEIVIPFVNWCVVGISRWENFACPSYYSHVFDPKDAIEFMRLPIKTLSSSRFCESQRHPHHKDGNFPMTEIIIIHTWLPSLKILVCITSPRPYQHASVVYILYYGFVYMMYIFTLSHVILIICLS